MFISSCEEGIPEIHGCLDFESCNYNSEATIDNNSCEYLQEGYDCEGNITEYIVGMEAEGGIVFYIDESGEHGLVAAMEDLGQFEWGCDAQYVSGADGTGIGTGFQNSLDIVAENCQTENGGVSAAQAALSIEVGGYEGWYLPSKDELVELYITIGNGGSDGGIGGFSSNGYWSSSEYSNNHAWSVIFSNGDIANGSKDYAGFVRVIRAF